MAKMADIHMTIQEWLLIRGYLRNGHIADDTDCFLHVLGRCDGGVGEAGEVAMREVESRECLGRREKIAATVMIRYFNIWPNN